MIEDGRMEDWNGGPRREIARPQEVAHPQAAARQMRSREVGDPGTLTGYLNSTGEFQNGGEWRHRRTNRHPRRSRIGMHELPIFIIVCIGPPAPWLVTVGLRAKAARASCSDVSGTSKLGSTMRVVRYLSAPILYPHFYLFVYNSSLVLLSCIVLFRSIDAPTT
jgi:hypothetical protein